jgi:protein TonB
MKNLLIAVCLLFSTTIFAQQEWGSVNKNTVTLKEIGPVWPGCESGSVSERDNCFNQKLGAHISKNFKFPKGYQKKEKIKVIVDFTINENGLVEVNSVSGGTKELQDEAERNILAIPKMAKPGMMAGKPRAIKMAVPFTF